MITPKQIADVISGPEGLEVEIFGLYICRLENGKYGVYEDDNEAYEALFDCPLKAAEHFLEIRSDLQKGFDFEKPRAGDV